MRCKKKLDSEVLVRAYVKRKNDIIRSNMTVMPPSSPGWSLLAADLGNVYATSTLCSLVRRTDIMKALVAEKTCTGKPYTSMRGRPASPLYESVPKSQLATSAAQNVRKQRKIEPNVLANDIPTRKAELVLPVVDPKRDASKEAPASSKTQPDTEDKKWPSIVDCKVQQPKVHVKKVITRKKGGRLLRVDRNTVIKEIFARRADIIDSKRLYVAQSNPVWKQITNVLGNRIHPVTVWRMAQRREVREMMVDEKTTTVAGNVPENGSGRRDDVGREVVINALLKHRAKIVLRDGCYVSKENPVWFGIADSLGKNVSAATVCQIAQKPEVREKMIIDDKKGIATISTDIGGLRKRRKIDPKIMIDAIVARREEIVSPKGYYARKEHPVWSRISKDLGEAIAPVTLHAVASRRDVRARVLLKDDKRNIPSGTVVEEREEETAGTDNFRNEINEMMFEDALNKLLKTVDSTDALTKEIKELRKDLRRRNMNNFDINALTNEIKGLRMELRRRDDDSFGTARRPILLN